MLTTGASSPAPISSTLTTSQSDTEITTLVQQLDQQGPIVLDRISTQFADVACTPQNARRLIDGLHTGTAITLSADGKTATFTPTTTLGYGETYIALALAADALRNAGVTGCATPDQWKAVLMGGPLAASGTTTTATTRSASASSSSNFPGILALRARGQGWGQVAQITHVQLGEVVSNARSSLNLNATNDSNLSPTGRSSAEMNLPSSGSSSERNPAEHAKANKNNTQNGHVGQADQADDDNDESDASSSSKDRSTVKPSDR